MISGSPALTPEQRSEFLELVDRHFGIRGSDYGASRLDDAVRHVLPSTNCATASELLDGFSRVEQPRWLYDLVEYLTVGETYFLRDPAQIAALRETILPDVLTRRAAQHRLRMWSAGCSTGEEPYTLAILLMEKGVTPAWDLQLVGTDVNRDSLRTAREGQYPAWSFRATPDDLRAQYFEPVERGWRLIEPIRRMARFAWMNLGAEAIMPPSGDMDLIVCRNVTIYFDDAATQRLYGVLVRALSPGGWLMLGPSDPLPVQRDGLERIEVNDTVLWRRVSAPKASLDQGVAPKTARRPADPAERARPPLARAASGTKPQAPQAATATDGAPQVARLVTSIVRTPATSFEPDADLEAGLLALESGASASAVESLRRATFRDPGNAIGQFALARAYLDLGDLSRAHAALLHTRRLLAPLHADDFVPGTDKLPVETLRQTIQTHLDSLHL